MNEYGAFMVYKNNPRLDPKIGGSSPTCSTYFYPCIQTILDENTHQSMGMCM